MQEPSYYTPTEQDFAKIAGGDEASYQRFAEYVFNSNSINYQALCDLAVYLAKSPIGLKQCVSKALLDIINNSHEFNQLQWMASLSSLKRKLIAVTQFSADKYDANAIQPLLEKDYIPAYLVILQLYHEENVWFEKSYILNLYKKVLTLTLVNSSEITDETKSWALLILGYIRKYGVGVTPDAAVAQTSFSNIKGLPQTSVDFYSSYTADRYERLPSNISVTLSDRDEQDYRNTLANIAYGSYRAVIIEGSNFTKVINWQEITDYISISRQIEVIRLSNIRLASEKDSKQFQYFLNWLLSYSPLKELIITNINLGNTSLDKHQTIADTLITALPSYQSIEILKLVNCALRPRHIENITKQIATRELAKLEELDIGNSQELGNYNIYDNNVLIDLFAEIARHNQTLTYLGIAGLNLLKDSDVFSKFFRCLEKKIIKSIDINDIKFTEKQILQITNIVERSSCVIRVETNNVDISEKLAKSLTERLIASNVARFTEALNKLYGNMGAKGKVTSQTPGQIRFELSETDENQEIVYHVVENFKKYSKTFKVEKLEDRYAISVVLKKLVFLSHREIDRLFQGLPRKKPKSEQGLILPGSIKKEFVRIAIGDGQAYQRFKNYTLANPETVHALWNALANYLIEKADFKKCDYTALHDIIELACNQQEQSQLGDSQLSQKLMNYTMAIPKQYAESNIEDLLQKDKLELYILSLKIIKRDQQKRGGKLLDSEKEHIRDICEKLSLLLQANILHRETLSWVHLTLGYIKQNKLDADTDYRDATAATSYNEALKLGNPYVQYYADADPLVLSYENDEFDWIAFKLTAESLSKMGVTKLVFKNIKFKENDSSVDFAQFPVCKVETVEVSYCEGDLSNLKTFIKRVSKTSANKKIVSNSKHVEKDWFDCLAEAVRNNKIKVLHVNINEISDRCFNELAEAVGQSSSLEEFKLCYLGLEKVQDTSQVVDLARAVLSNRHIKRVSWEGKNLLTDALVEKLVDFAPSKQIDILCLVGLGNGKQVFAKLASNIRDIKLLDISENSLDSNELKSFFEQLAKNDNELKEIILSRSSSWLQLEALTALGDYLISPNCQLTVLKADTSDFSDATLMTFKTYLSQNNTLMALDFSNTALTMEGAKILLQILKQNPNITAINLTNCPAITQDMLNTIDICLWKNAKNKNNPLKRLQYTDCKLSPLDLKTMSRELKQDKIESLSIDHCDYAANQFELDELSDAIKNNNSALVIEIKYLGGLDSAAHEEQLNNFYSALFSNKSVAQIHLEGMRLGKDTTITSIVDSLCSNDGLQVIYLVNCGLTDGCLLKLVEDIDETTKLESIDLGNTPGQEESRNEFSAEILVEFFSTLIDTQLPLKVIKLSGLKNLFETSVVSALVNFLVQCKINELDLSYSDFNDAGIDRLLESLNKNEELIKIDLTKCDKVSDENKRIVQRAVIENQLKFLRERFKMMLEDFKIKDPKIITDYKDIHIIFDKPYGEAIILGQLFLDTFGKTNCTLKILETGGCEITLTEIEKITISDVEEIGCQFEDIKELFALIITEGSAIPEYYVKLKSRVRDILLNEDLSKHLLRWFLDVTFELNSDLKKCDPYFIADMAIMLNGTSGVDEATINKFYQKLIAKTNCMFCNIINKKDISISYKEDIFAYYFSLLVLYYARMNQKLPVADVAINNIIIKIKELYQSRAFLVKQDELGWISLAYGYICLQKGEWLSAKNGFDLAYRCKNELALFYKLLLDFYMSEDEVFLELMPQLVNDGVLPAYFYERSNDFGKIPAGRGNVNVKTADSITQSQSILTTDISKVDTEFAELQQQASPHLSQAFSKGFDDPTHYETFKSIFRDQLLAINSHRAVAWLANELLRQDDLSKADPYLLADAAVLFIMNSKFLADLAILALEKITPFSDLKNSTFDIASLLKSNLAARYFVFLYINMKLGKAETKELYQSAKDKIYQALRNKEKLNDKSLQWIQLAMGYLGMMYQEKVAFDTIKYVTTQFSLAEEAGNPIATFYLLLYKYRIVNKQSEKKAVLSEIRKVSEKYFGAHFFVKEQEKYFFEGNNVEVDDNAERLTYIREFLGYVTDSIIKITITGKTGKIDYNFLSASANKANTYSMQLKAECLSRKNLEQLAEFFLQHKVCSLFIDINANNPPFTQGCISNFISKILSAKELKTLSLGGVFANEIVLDELAKNLPKSALKNLSLHNVTSRSGFLAKLAVHLSEVKSLTISSANLLLEDYRDFFSNLALNQSNKLAMLYLTNMATICHAMSSLSDFLKNDLCHIKLLSFANSSFGDDELEQLKEAIECNKSLEILDLSGTKLSDKSVSTLLSILHKNTRIANIELQGCAISSTEVTRIKTDLVIRKLEQFQYLKEKLDVAFSGHFHFKLRDSVNTLSIEFTVKNEISKYDQLINDLVASLKSAHINAEFNQATRILLFKSVTMINPKSLADVLYKFKEKLDNKLCEANKKETDKAQSPENFDQQSANVSLEPTGKEKNATKPAGYGLGYDLEVLSSAKYEKERVKPKKPKNPTGPSNREIYEESVRKKQEERDSMKQKEEELEKQKREQQEKNKERRQAIKKQKEEKKRQEKPAELAQNDKNNQGTIKTSSTRASLDSGHKQPLFLSKPQKYQTKPGQDNENIQRQAVVISSTESSAVLRSGVSIGNEKQREQRESSLKKKYQEPAKQEGERQTPAPKSQKEEQTKQVGVKSSYHQTARRLSDIPPRLQRRKLQQQKFVPKEPSGMTNVTLPVLPVSDNSQAKAKVTFASPKTLNNAGQTQIAPVKKEVAKQDDLSAKAFGSHKQAVTYLTPPGLNPNAKPFLLREPSITPSAPMPYNLSTTSHANQFGLFADSAGSIEKSNSTVKVEQTQPNEQPSAPEGYYYDRSGALRYGQAPKEIMLKHGETFIAINCENARNVAKVLKNV